ncbi:MAG: AAA family ATPase [Candidatus Aenigmarchaeota archaeon]|nr:AAA family ATPase [Candidatus Aenigmarchaeota archaeon]
MQKIIGIIGRIGAGKDTVAEYIARKYGYAVVAFRDAVKEVTEKEGLELTRANMQAVSKKYRDRYGGDYFTNIIMKKVAESGPKIIIKEMRTEGDVLPLKNMFRKMKIILIEADAEKRFERMFARGRAGDPQTLEEFEGQEKREEELGYTQALQYDDFKINNNGTLGELYEKVDKLFKTTQYDE